MNSALRLTDRQAFVLTEHNKGRTCVDISRDMKRLDRDGYGVCPEIARLELAKAYRKMRASGYWISGEEPA